MKHQRMYKTLLIFGILSNLFLISCDEGEVERIIRRAYNYNNSTLHTLKILEWKQGNQTVFTIRSNETLNYKITLGTGGVCKIDGAISESSECLLIHSDSVKVIFDNSKFLEFNKESISNLNILKQENYDYEKINNEHTYTYNFLELHYDNAEDCNGNCD